MRTGVGKCDDNQVPALTLTCTFRVELRGIEPLTSALQKHIEQNPLTCGKAEKPPLNCGFVVLSCVAPYPQNAPRADPPASSSRPDAERTLTFDVGIAGRRPPILGDHWP